MCFGGSSANTDRKTQLASEADLSGIYKMLGSQGANILGQGANALNAGLGDTAKASKYYSDILSGDPTKVMAAVQPETKAITDQANQNKKVLAATGDRTGGTNAAIQDLNTSTRGAIADTISKARGGAAGGLERTGSEVSRVGLGLTGEGLGAESTAGGLAGQLANTAAASRKTSQEIHDAAVQQWADVVAAVLFG